MTSFIMSLSSLRWIKVNKKRSYLNETVRLLHNIESINQEPIKNGLLSIAALMLDYNDIVVMCLQLITLRIVSWQHNGAEKNS